MAKPGRPSIPYEKFIEVWEQLLTEGRAGTNIACDILGGSKSTIAAYRERYEREKTSKELSIIKSVELTDAVHHAIAGIKVKEIEALEKENTQLKGHIDSYLASLKELEEKLAAKQVDLEEFKASFDAEKLKLERKLAATQARAEDLEHREQKILTQYNQVNDAYNQAKQEAAVAKKEVDMLREQIKFK